MAENEEIFGQARSAEAHIVILDNISTLADIKDENEASAMSPILTFLLRMKQA